MKIKMKINGKEIVGYWNGKTYKSRKDPEKNIRIYIDNVEYDIPKDQFKYEEVFSEKQIQYAKQLKQKFLEKLNKIFEDHPFNPEPATIQTIINYFQEKDDLYFLKKKNFLDRILNNIFQNPSLAEKVIKKNFKKIEIKKGQIDEELAKELLATMFAYKIKHDYFASYNLSDDFTIKEDEKNYYIQETDALNAYEVDKKSFSVKEIPAKKILEKKNVARLYVEV